MQGKYLWLPEFLEEVKVMKTENNGYARNVRVTTKISPLVICVNSLYRFSPLITTQNASGILIAMEPPPVRVCCF